MRYSTKVTAVGLKDSPYTIPDEQWAAVPSDIPNVAWSNMFACVPSAYTREEV